MSSSRPITIDRCVCQRALFRDLLPRARVGEWTVADLVNRTGCGDQCGMCLPYLRQMLRDGTTVFHHLITSDEESA